MVTKRRLPAIFEELPFSRTTALSAGVTSGRLRARDLRAPFHAVRVDSSLPDDVFWRCRAYTERMSAANAFSHHTAAELYGFPLPLYARRDRNLHVARPAGGTVPVGRGVRGHEVSAKLWMCRDVIHRDHGRGELFVLRALSPALVWAQLSTLLDIDDLVAVGDSIVTGVEPLASTEELSAIAALCGGRRGALALREALPLIRVGPLSRPESLIRLQMMKAGLPEPALNVAVNDQRGDRIGEPDFCWPEFRVLAEYDSERFHGESRRRPDRERMELYADGGWAGLVAYATDAFTDPNAFLQRLARRLRTGGWQSDSEPWRIAGARR